MIDLLSHLDGSEKLHEVLTSVIVHNQAVEYERVSWVDVICLEKSFGIFCVEIKVNPVLVILWVLSDQRHYKSLCLFGFPKVMKNFGLFSQNEMNLWLCQFVILL